MNKTKYVLMAMTLFVVLFASACGGSAAPAEQSAPPAVESVPTQAPPPAEVVQPTQESAPAQAFAPACQATASCTPLTLTDKPAYETYCVRKVPYQNFLVPPGTIFEPLPKAGDPEFYPLQCADSGTTQDGLSFYSCFGQELWTYDLKVTNPACAGSTLQAGTTQCEAGLGYDAANNCCAPMAGGDAGSVIIKVNMGGCPIK
jgi:hypothetical protein